MNIKELKVVFFGTPDFAVASLEAIYNAGINILAVVTAPDKPSGRGMKMNESAVKTFALANNLPLLQPEKLKNEAFIQELKNLNADLHIVVAFRMLPEIVWNMPKFGTINVHGSLLPKYRGAAPINWAIINGEKETGVTTFKLKHEIDTGNILLQHSIEINDTDNVGTIYTKLMHEGAQLLVQTLEQLCNNTLTEKAQILDTNNHTHAPKIFKKDCLIDWNKDAISIINLIRGLSPSPAAYTLFEDKTLKIYHAVISDFINEAPLPGTINTDHKNTLKIASQNAWISLIDLQLEGKKRMQVADFLRGYKVNASKI
jgi:methionyl-tRNA formyltransferase